MKVLFGLETPQTGKVYMDGKEVKILNTLDAIEKGSVWSTSILC